MSSVLGAVGVMHLEADDLAIKQVRATATELMALATRIASGEEGTLYMSHPRARTSNSVIKNRRNTSLCALSSAFGRQCLHGVETGRSLSCVAVVS